MSLLGALDIGQSGLAASQTAIEVAGNNLANVATPGYHEQTVVLDPAPSQQIQQGVFEGRGVTVAQIAQQINQGLESQLRNAVSDQSGANITQSTLTSIQSAENELSGTDVSSQLTAFFNAWSELANTPNDTSAAETVVQQGQSLVSTINNLSSGALAIQAQVNTSLAAATNSANGMLTQIAGLNQQIAQSTVGTASSNSLVDQRDSLLSSLSQYVNISTNQNANGQVNVYVGSTPLVLGSTSEGLQTLQQTLPNGQSQTVVSTIGSSTIIQPTSGQIGALINSQNNDVGGEISTLNSFANQLAQQVNLVYSQGQGQTGITSVTGTNSVADATAALNSTAAGLTNPPTNGSFNVTVTNANGQTTTTTINVNLNGVDPSSQTSLTSLVASLNAVSGVQASITPNGNLQVNSTGSGNTITFGSDTSGTLAALGVNTFFTGNNAGNLGINNAVVQDPSQLAVAQSSTAGDNSNALAIANLATQTIPALNNNSISDVWSNHVADYAQRLGQATQQVTSDDTVVSSLQSQQQSISGVNTDQETINLLAFQNAYQGSARYLSTLQTILEVLMQMG